MSRLRLLALVLAGLGVVWLVLAVSVLSGTPNWAEDFGAYRDAAIRLHDEGSLYLAASLERGFQPQGQGLYLYPPPLGIAFTGFAGLGAETGAVAWYLAKVVALALAAAVMPVRTTTRLLAFGVSVFGFAVLRDLTEGNVSVLITLGFALGWRYLDRPVGSVALALATSVRATTGVFLLWFAVRRRWRPLVWMLATGVVLIVLTLPFVGVDGYRDYFTLLANVSDPGDLGQNRHLTRLALELGLGADRLWLVLVPTWILTVAAIIASTRRDAATGYMVTAAASLLLAPLMWDHYLTILMLPAAFLFERGRSWGMALPLFSWAPAPLMPLVAVAALLLPFAARPADGDGPADGSDRRAPEPAASVP